MNSDDFISIHFICRQELHADNHNLNESASDHHIQQGHQGESKALNIPSFVPFWQIKLFQVTVDGPREPRSKTRKLNKSNKKNMKNLFQFPS